MARRRRPSESRSLTPTSLVWLGVAIVILIGIVVALLPKSNIARDGTTTPVPDAAGPRVGDHWHAILTISICGEVQPPLPDSSAFDHEIHTHGDGLIHIEVATPASAGANANLGRFFASTRIILTNETIQLPGGRLYRNGDLCPDGTPARMRFFVNQAEISAVTDFLSTVPRDGDTVQVEFSSSDDTPR